MAEIDARISEIDIEIEEYQEMITHSIQTNADCSAHLQEMAGSQDRQHHLKLSHGVSCGSFCLL